MKYRPRVSEVEAVQVCFGSRGWPTWLAGRVGIGSEGCSEGGEEAAYEVIGEGDYLVHQGGGVIEVMTAEGFGKKYAAVRQRNKLDDTGLRGSQAPGTDAGGNAE